MTATALVLATTEAPDQYEVTPGLLGFVVTFVVAIAFIVLIRSFVKTMRKANLNERRRQEEAAAAAAAAAEEAGRSRRTGAETGAASDQGAPSDQVAASGDAEARSEGPQDAPSITEVRRPE